MTENDVKLLYETEQRSKLNAEQIQEIRRDLKEMQEKQSSIYELTYSIKQIVEKIDHVSEDITEVKDSQKEFVLEVKDNQKELSSTISTIEDRVTDVENKPAKETAETVNKIKVAVFVAIATFLATGILGSIIMFAMK